MRLLGKKIAPTGSCASLLNPRSPLPCVRCTAPIDLDQIRRLCLEVSRRRRPSARSRFTLWRALPVDNFGNRERPLFGVSGL